MILRWHWKENSVNPFYFNTISSLPQQSSEKKQILQKLLGKTGKNFIFTPPFFCDYGYNIEIGENFYANTNLVILDAAKVRVGDNVFIAPHVGIYTAGHPLDIGQRNAGLEYARPITIGNNVWIGGHVVLLPGVSIGDNTTIGAGSVCNQKHAGQRIGCGKSLPGYPSGIAKRKQIVYNKIYKHYTFM